MNEWIRVKDQLPPEGEPVLAICAGGSSGYPTLITVEWNKTTGWTTDIPDAGRLIISYWKEHPECPEKWWE